MKNNTEIDHITQTVDAYEKNSQQYATQAEYFSLDPEMKRFLHLLPLPPANILDLACGSGRDSRLLSSKGYNVIGVDLSSALLAIAKKNAPLAKFKKQDLRNLQFHNNFFDAVWASAALVHLKKTELPHVLSSLFLLIKPGGLAFLHQKKGKGEGFSIEPSMPSVKRYYSYYEKDEFEKYVTNAGFIIIDSYVYCDTDRFIGKRDTEWISCFTKKTI